MSSAILQRNRFPATRWLIFATLTILFVIGLREHQDLSAGFHFGGFADTPSIQHGWDDFQDWTFAPEAVAGMQLRDLRVLHTQAERRCNGWTAELAILEGQDEWDDCWRHKPYRQLYRFLQMPSKPSLHPLDEALASLSKLLDCYADVLHELDCPANMFRVLAGDYGFFTGSFRDNPFPPGEVVWQRGQILALQEMNYTLIGVKKAYRDVVELHRLLPDVISRIWTDDVHHMTCEHDPRCISNMSATRETYPGFELFGNDAMWLGPLGPPDNDAPLQRWLWRQDELEKIPKHERGTIPRWKLFSASVWGSFPGESRFRIPTTGDFAYSQLGPQWTVASFRYPNHTYLPFTVEYTCKRTPTWPTELKEDAMFVLTKKTDFFYDRTAPKPDDWKSLATATGMSMTCSAQAPSDGSYPLPEGLLNVGHLNPDEFAVQLSKSKAMIGIGHPLISPSPYIALCQGTPVLMPYYDDEPETMWDLMRAGRHSQHGPLLLQSGPPYVYPYNAGNYSDLLHKMQLAAANPIERYIIPEQSWDNVKAALDWYMWFDWETLAQSVLSASGHQFPLSHLLVTARCFDMGRCQPL